jgi:hypothetical protein
MIQTLSEIVGKINIKSGGSEVRFRDSRHLRLRESTTLRNHNSGESQIHPLRRLKVVLVTVKFHHTKIGRFGTNLAPTAQKWSFSKCSHR